LHSFLKAQSVSFALKTSPSSTLTFDTFDKYQYGIVLPNFVTLKVETIGTEWDLYVGTTTTVAGVFDMNNSYGTTGSASIPVNILQARVYTTSNSTQTGTSFFNLNDIASPTYLIGSSANDAAITCGSVGTNVAGSYTSDPQCYNFKVDLKATPGLGYRAGSYSLRIDFILVQDL
jgi:hypothetical protein